MNMTSSLSKRLKIRGKPLSLRNSRSISFRRRCQALLYDHGATRVSVRRNDRDEVHRRSRENGVQAIGKSRGGWTTKIHMVAADARCASACSLTAGRAGDAPAGRELRRNLPNLSRRCRLIRDRAYEGNETRPLAL
jgi:hypothetical protein